MNHALGNVRMSGFRRKSSGAEASAGEPWSWAEVFVICQTALPAILYLPGTQGIRPVARVGAYAISLLILFAGFSKNYFNSKNLHSSFGPLKVCIAFLSLMVFHPLTANFTVGIATVGFYLAILAPLIWAPWYVKSPERLHCLLWILLICNGVNSLVGVLQVHDPARWMPVEFSEIVMRSSAGLSVVTYKGADGSLIIRPPGLFDTPGAVAGPGLLAGFLGLVLSMQAKDPRTRFLAAGLAFCGISVIYLSLVRSALLVMAGMLGAYGIVQHQSSQRSKVTQLLILVTLVSFGGYKLAAIYGGESIEQRFSSIIEEKPTEFYYRWRGIDVENGFKEILPKYPLGAGLGRWGMVSHYLGGGGGSEGGMSAETQFPAWIIDGGAVLLMGYCMALWIALRSLYEVIQKTSHERLQSLSIIVLAMSFGMVAHCFSFPVFSTQLGLQFWFLIGASFGAVRHASDSASLPKTHTEAERLEKKRFLYRSAD